MGVPSLRVRFSNSRLVHFSDGVSTATSFASSSRVDTCPATPESTNEITMSARNTPKIRRSYFFRFFW